MWLALQAIELSQFLELVRKVFDIVAAYLSEENLPLIEKYLRLWILCFKDFVIERSDALLSDQAVRTKIPMQVFRLIGFTFLSEVIERPE